MTGEGFAKVPIEIVRHSPPWVTISVARLEALGWERGYRKQRGPNAGGTMPLSAEDLRFVTGRRRADAVRRRVEQLHAHVGNIYPVMVSARGPLWGWTFGANQPDLLVVRGAVSAESEGQSLFSTRPRSAAGGGTRSRSEGPTPRPLDTSTRRIPY